MPKLLIIFLLFFTSLCASQNWVIAYQKGEYPKQPDYIYALAETTMGKKHYKQKAKLEALEDLSSQLYTQVTSDKKLILSFKNNQSSREFTQNIHIISSMPIHGAIIENESNENRTYYLLMALDKKSAAPIYKKRANELARSIEDYYQRFKSEKQLRSKIALLEQIAKEYSEFEQNALVASLLGEEGIVKPSLLPYDIEQLQEKLLALKATDEKELAYLVAAKISHAVKKRPLKVHALSYLDTDSFTPFSRSFQNYLMDALRKKESVTDDANAYYSVKGNYLIKDNTVIANVFVYDNLGRMQQSVIAELTINKSNLSYYEPQKTNTYESINEKVLSNGFSVQARLNGQKENIILTEGQSADIQVKTSQEAYVWIIANMRTQGGKQIQYLLPIGNAGNTYLYHIPYQNSNLWIPLVEFEVFPPFGQESLQIFAATQKVSLPNIQTKKIDGELYEGVLVGDNDAVLNAEVAIQRSRGLKRKQTKKPLEMSETLIRFTTMPK